MADRLPGEDELVVGESPFAPRSSANRLAIWGLCALVIGGFGGLDLLLFPAIQPGSPVPIILRGALVGFVIGQVNLIATWAVLAPGNLVVRLPWSLLLGMGMWYALVCGSSLFRRMDWLFPAMDSADVLLLGIVLGASIVLLQIPLWIAKRTFRWRMIREGETRDDVRENRQFQLKHMLLGTLLLALALAPLRSLLPQEETYLLLPGLYEMLIFLGAILLWNLVVTIPCIWGGLLPSARTVPVAFAWTIYCLVLTLVEIGAFCLLLGPPGPQPIEECLVLYVMNLGQCVAVFGTLRLFRRLGFRLVRLPAAA